MQFATSHKMTKGRSVVALSALLTSNAKDRVMAATKIGQFRKSDKASIMKRFMSFVSPEPNSGCWLWDGAWNSEGYGQLGVMGKRVGAYRVSYEIFRGEIPRGFLVRHKCDVRCCVNPDHLLLGTDKDNMDDRSARGRAFSKLTNEQVVVIKAELFAAKRGVGARLAQQYGVTPSVISEIRNSIAWAHIPWPDGTVGSGTLRERRAARNRIK